MIGNPRAKFHIQSRILGTSVSEIMVSTKKITKFLPRGNYILKGSPTSNRQHHPPTQWVQSWLTWHLTHSPPLVVHSIRTVFIQDWRSNAWVLAHIKDDHRFISDWSHSIQMVYLNLICLLPIINFCDYSCRICCSVFRKNAQRFFCQVRVEINILSVNLSTSLLEPIIFNKPLLWASRGRCSATWPHEQGGKTKICLEQRLFGRKERRNIVKLGVINAIPDVLRIFDHRAKAKSLCYHWERLHYCSVATNCSHGQSRTVSKWYHAQALGPPLANLAPLRQRLRGTIGDILL